MTCSSLARLVATLTAAAVLAACGTKEVTKQEAQVAENSRVEQNNGLSPAIDEKVAVEEGTAPGLEPFKADRTPDVANAAITCSFRMNGSALLITGLEPVANARGKGLVLIGGEERVLTGTEALGVPGMRAGPTMTDGEFTVNVVRDAGKGEADATAHEWPASLIQRMNMAHERRYGPGVWTCSK